MKSSWFFGLVLFATACAPQTVSAPSLAPTCDQVPCRANAVCVNGYCQATDGGAGEGSDAGASNNRPDAGEPSRPDAGEPSRPDAGEPSRPDAGSTPIEDAGVIVTPDAGEDVVSPGGDGSRRSEAALSCQELHRQFPDQDSDEYWIDPDGENGPIEAMRLFCGMRFDSGGWTHVAHLVYGDTVWDGWNEEEGRPDNDRESWGVPFRWFSQEADGQDLEIAIGVAESSAGDYFISKIFADVHKDAWRPGVRVEENIDDGFDVREEDEEFERCDSEIWRRNRRWSWAISRGEDGCAGWSGGGGFVIYGSDRDPEGAFSIWGLDNFGAGNQGARFGSVDILIRQR